MKEYIIAVAAVLIAAEMIMLIMPDGAGKRLTGIALGVFVMTMLISPVKSCDLSFPGVSYGEEQNEQSYTDMILGIYERTFENTDR